MGELQVPPWVQFDTPLFSNEDLLREVQKIPQLVNSGQFGDVTPRGSSRAGRPHAWSPSGALSSRDRSESEDVRSPSPPHSGSDHAPQPTPF